MDMFITIFDVETNEITYINKNVINLIGMDVKHNIAEIVVGGVQPHLVTLEFSSGEGLNNFMKAIEGKVCRVSECTVKTKVIN